DPWSPGAASRWWLHHALDDLRERLADRGARLVIRNGDTGRQLDRLIVDSGASGVYWNRLYEPAIVERDRRIKAHLKSESVVARSFRAAMLFEPWELLKDDETPYQVFTPFWKRMQRNWRSVQPRPEPRELNDGSGNLESLELDQLELLPTHDWGEGLAEYWTPGELAARRRLKAFAEEPVRCYDDSRNLPDRAGTSGLSPYLHFGHVSPTRIVHELEPSGELPGGKGALSLVRELAWREFSATLLYHSPRLADHPMQTRFEQFPWRTKVDYASDLKAWQRGRTGVPLVDAGMRQLWQTGWMHNRVRMVVASYLTKNLLVPWQEGARWFWDTLVDADLANNSQGWQWVAGCGADAAPYFRVFNPELQAAKFDPDAAYVRKWCPELQGLDAAALARLGDDERQRRDYPSMRVDLKQSRLRALEAFDSTR
ncbi:MAG: deoxyribodipyrimidine photo-lyase, partial [Wenzhouxiangellaceae bacterium]